MVQAGELQGRCILIVEDEWLLADAISDAVERAGGTLLGPTGSVKEALSILVEAERLPDAASLNIRVLDGESYPVADELARLGVPFVFASANGSSSLPARFARRPMIAKPFPGYRIAQALAALLSSG